MYARTRMVFGNLPSPRHCVTKPQPAISIAVAKIQNKKATFLIFIVERKNLRHLSKVQNNEQKTKYYLRFFDYHLYSNTVNTVNF